MSAFEWCWMVVNVGVLVAWPILVYGEDRWW